MLTWTKKIKYVCLNTYFFPEPKQNLNVYTLQRAVSEVECVANTSNSESIKYRSLLHLVWRSPSASFVCFPLSLNLTSNLMVACELTKASRPWSPILQNAHIQFMQFPKIHKYTTENLLCCNE